MSRRSIRLTGSSELIGFLPTLFTGQTIAVTSIDATHCWLTSPLLESAPDLATFLEESRTLVKRIAALIQIYHGGNELQLDAYTYPEAGDAIVTATLSNPFRIRIVSTTGLPHLQSQGSEGDTTCAELLSIAATNDQLGRTLDIVGSDLLGWSGMYDVIEVIGERIIVGKFKRMGVALDKDYLKDLKRTANVYRHRGTPNKYSLPTRKIELSEARKYIARLLQCWLEKSRRVPGNLNALDVPVVSDDLVVSAAKKRKDR